MRHPVSIFFINIIVLVIWSPDCIATTPLHHCTFYNTSGNTAALYLKLISVAGLLGLLWGLLGGEASEAAEAAEEMAVECPARAIIGLYSRWKSRTRLRAPSCFRDRPSIKIKVILIRSCYKGLGLNPVKGLWWHCYVLGWSQTLLECSTQHINNNSNHEEWNNNQKWQLSTQFESPAS